MAKQHKAPKDVDAYKHGGASRPNIPTAENASLADGARLTAEIERRDPDQDPQLVWKGKDTSDWADLAVPAPPLFIQEKVSPQALIADLRRRSVARKSAAAEADAPTLFGDPYAEFNGFPEGAEVTDFYRHEGKWQNRMILGDSLHVMASLAEREGLRGKVQCVYLDPPYGIKFNSNFQWSTTTRDVKDGKLDHLTREPEQVKAFRDTWRHGVHSYLTYLRDRLTVVRDLLHETGSVFVQIGDENVHRVRAVMDEVFGDGHLVSQITVKKTSGASAQLLPGISDYVLWYAKSLECVKYRQMFRHKRPGEAGATQYRFVAEDGMHRRSIGKEESLEAAARKGKIFAHGDMTSQRPPGDFPVLLEGKTVRPPKGYWKTGEEGMSRLVAASRLMFVGNTMRYVRYLDDFPVYGVTNLWDDTVTSGFSDPKLYIVQTNASIIQRCLLMATDPGDLVLDPTCGSGTTAYVAEQWGRRWVTIDTSRVALALARARVMGAKYPYWKVSVETGDGVGPAAASC